MQGNVLAAVQAYHDAQTIDSGLEIDAEVWDRLCWVGALNNQAAVIQYASEKATHLHPDWPVFRDTRGLVRALTGDLQGAIEDFELVLEKLSCSTMYASRYRLLGLESHGQQRREWLEVLRSGQNPFTPNVLVSVSKEGGSWNRLGIE